MNRSIRRGLMLMLVAAVVLLIGSSLVVSYLDIGHESEEMYDAELAKTSRILESLLLATHNAETIRQLDDRRVEHNMPEPSLNVRGDDKDEYDESGHKYENKLSFQVWHQSGKALIGSGQKSFLGFPAGPGFTYADSDLGDWRTFALFSDRLQSWIIVGQRMDLREELTEEIAEHNVVPMMVVIPVLLVLIGFIIQRGFMPLIRVSGEISQRGPDMLTPISEEGVPAELTDMVSSVNRLMSRLEQALEQQKRFTSNAAHEIRTPLAAIRIHAQNLPAESDDVKRVRQQILSGTDRLTHMVNQLLTLSRIEAAESCGDRRCTDPAELIETLLGEFRLLTAEKQQQIALLVPKPVKAELNPDAFLILMRNLVDNAVRYTPAGGQLLVDLKAEEQSLVVVVQDSGPGLTAEQRQQVFDRFYRAGGNDVEGCGIGMSIVAEICQRCDFRIELQDSDIADTGLKVVVTCEAAILVDEGAGSGTGLGPALQAEPV
ncbi:ATP-binding protein [Marinobacterium jannaschii]|uniref:ATP-binding protein n=1 Tax=Marinobacterium jannaschii TaxID=64970 RepID=UPI00048684A1|nr:ATP-binding protein [Marinobacterium jannaschii]